MTILSNPEQEDIDWNLSDTQLKTKIFEMDLLYLIGQDFGFLPKILSTEILYDKEFKIFLFFSNVLI